MTIVCGYRTYYLAPSLLKAATASAFYMLEGSGPLNKFSPFEVGMFVFKTFTKPISTFIVSESCKGRPHLLGAELDAGHQRHVVDGGVALHLLHSGEGPAAAARALVLGVAHRARLAPVHLLGQLPGRAAEGGGGGGGRGGGADVAAAHDLAPELGLGHVRELGDGHPPRLPRPRVVLPDLSQVGLEHRVPKVIIGYHKLIDL